MFYDYNGLVKTLIFLLTFLTIFEVQASPWVLAFVDTPLCQTKLPSRVVTHQSKDLKPKACQNLSRFDRSIHGQFVLELLLKGLTSHEGFTLHHFNVFDKEGNQDPKLWKKTLEELEQLKPDLTLMALGYMGESSSFPQSLSAPTLVASGTQGYGVSLSTRLWPHELSDPKLILVGHFIPSLYQHLAPQQNLPKGHLDPEMLYAEKTEFYLKQSRDNKGLGGTSRASALAFLLALKACPSSLKSKDIKALRSCLQAHAQKFQSPQGKIFWALQD